MMTFLAALTGLSLEELGLIQILQCCVLPYIGLSFLPHCTAKISLMLLSQPEQKTMQEIGILK